MTGRSDVRVVSLVPAATELLEAAGGSSLLVGRSHECDWPPSITDRPALTRQRTDAGTPGEIDQQVLEAREADQSLYELDTEQLASLKPDVILTQDLCDVCSIDLNSVRAVAESMTSPPEVVSLNPTRIEDVFDDLVRIGTSCGLESSTRDARTMVVGPGLRESVCRWPAGRCSGMDGSTFRRRTLDTRHRDCGRRAT